MPMMPAGTAPSQVDLDRALASADGAELRVEGELVEAWGPGAVASLRGALRLGRGGEYKPFSDPPGSARVDFLAEGVSTCRLIVYPDLAVRLDAFHTASRIEQPRALGAFLAERGCPGLLAVHDFLWSTAARDRSAQVLAIAPEPLHPLVDALCRDPWAFDVPRYQAAFEALTVACGGRESAFFRLCAWYGALRLSWDPCFVDPPLRGALPGPRCPIEQVTDGLMRMFGVQEAIALAANEVPDNARAGLCRFLVDNVRSRGFEVIRRIPRQQRGQLVQSVARTGAFENDLRTQRLLLDEGALAPEGTTLFAASLSGRFARLAASGDRVFAVDGYEIVRLGRGERTVLTPIVRPDTPLAVHKGEVWFLHPSGPRSMSVEGGETRSRSAPWFGRAERKVSREISRYAQAIRDASAGDRTFPIDRDACEAYSAFGGDLPAELESPFYFFCSPGDRVLYRLTRSGEKSPFDLGGRAIALTSGAGFALAMVEYDDGYLGVVRADGQGLSLLGRFRAPSGRAKGIVPYLNGALVRLRASLGEVLVALEPRAG